MTQKIAPFTKDTFTPVKMSLAQVNEHLAAYLVSLREKSKETLGTYQRCLRDFIYFFTVDKNFNFTVKDVERYKHYLIHQKKMAEVSMSQYLTALRRFCNYLVETGVLEKNPAKRVNGGRRPQKHSRSFLTIEEIEQLFRSIEGESWEALRDRAIVHLMLGCAVSELELTRMDVGDLRKEGKKWTIVVQGKGKSIKDVAVAVPLKAVEAVQAYLTLRPGVTPDAPLILSRSSRSKTGHMSIRAMRQLIHNRFKESGIKQGRDLRLTPFSLRHTTGLILAETGVSVEYLMQRLRLEWRPTALIYFKQVGKFGLSSKPEIADYVKTEE